MQIFVDILTQTFRALWAHRLRTFLTMFGIAWGVGSLLLLVGLGEGFRSGTRRDMEELGKDIMFIWGGRAPAVQGNMASARWYQLTYQDYLGIQEAPYVRRATPCISSTDVHAVSEFANANGQLLGCEPQYAEIRYLPVKDGRWLNTLDEAQKRNVIVLGDELTRHLFPGRPPLGAKVLLNGVEFEVVGTIQRVGHGDENSTNMRAYIPFRVMSMYFPVKGEEGRTAVSFVNFQPRTRQEHLLATREAHKVIARNHGFDASDENAFEGWDTIKQAEAMGAIFDAMNAFLGSVGMVTLGLGAIGVVNIMLVSVSERTSEIGLRKALGATNRSILAQFFFEGVLLTMTSGFIGIAGAGLLMRAMSGIKGPNGFDPPKLIPATAMLAIFSLTLSGVAAGLYPAQRASALTPVEALRKD
ncbi:ABC efflux pump, inner membrane subunit [Candidatus Koribacter versatilis Ellin345]|uniref:ABC efflux pump, inner membrane subunit n=1 Tax=Koribacter versatilis (strain Ellin345) TaxID=204669 RepID=Q1IRJ3_KORVE|nr:ABC transporter permease [Candidatus Koribacter versatilis]ABF40507.1 ABC efflux pump, inner membrane subunit [Candidatus Koribacter versatilis Ellin345]